MYSAYTLSEKYRVKLRNVATAPKIEKYMPFKERLIIFPLNYVTSVIIAGNTRADESSK